MSSDALKVAAVGNNIDGLYQEIQQDPRILESIDSIPFVETPMHVAASLGHFEFATEIMTLKPSFAQKLNPEGFTPIHLALQCNHDEMVLRLVEMNKDLVRVKGREGFTALHLASQENKTELLDKFLKACPDSIEDVTARSETALHIAVKHGHYETLQVLFRWLMRNSRKDSQKFIRTMLDWKDQKGNTVLHVAALYGHIEAVSLLSTIADLDARNLEGQTASDIARSDHMRRILIRGRGIIEYLRLLRNKFRIFFLRCRRYMTEEERNAYLVVAALIATATYQAALSPPGGLYPSDVGTNNNTSHVVASTHSINEKSSIPKDGNSIMSAGEFNLFSIVNMSSFITSTFAIILLLPRTNILMWCLLYSPPLFLQLSFCIAMMVISPTPLNVHVVMFSFMVYVLFYSCFL
ncbi:Ankyrin repeat-containing protein BDA1 [Glycine soja]